MKKFLMSLVAFAVLPLALQAQAQSNAKSPEPTWNKTTPEMVQALQTKANPKHGATLFAVCESCHRKDAAGRSSGAYPRLAGQHVNVLIKQMLDFHTGLRANPKMQEYVVDHLSNPADIADVAAYLSALPIPAQRIGRGPGTGLTAGKALYDRDCAQCHGKNGEGNAEAFYPMVAAQHNQYLLRELHFIRDGDRGNANPDMARIIESYGEVDLDVLADYISSLPPPRK
jgi:cytochrome c553